MSILAPSGDTTIEDREKGLEEPTWIRGNYIKETVHLDLCIYIKETVHLD